MLPLVRHGLVSFSQICMQLVRHQRNMSPLLSETKLKSHQGSRCQNLFVELFVLHEQAAWSSTPPKVTKTSSVACLLHQSMFTIDKSVSSNAGLCMHEDLRV